MWVADAMAMVRHGSREAPLGYFDPLGLSKDGDVETFRRRRECELKNGRVAMFATIGCVATCYANMLWQHAMATMIMW